MKRIFAATLLTLALCSCGGQAPHPQAIADKAIIPAYPPAPVDTTRPLPKPAMPELKCLQATERLCPGRG